MKTLDVTIAVVARPFTLTFASTGQSYPLTSEDAQRLIDQYPATVATKYRVSLRGDSRTSDATIRPATVGGGPAFIVTRKGGTR
jgi:hypothetical protein